MDSLTIETMSHIFYLYKIQHRALHTDGQKTAGEWMLSVDFPDVIWR